MRIRPGGQQSTLFLLFLTGLLGELDYQVIPPLLPLLAQSFQMQPGSAGRVVPAYALSAGISSFLFGYISDRAGRKPFIVAGLFGFSLAAILGYAAGSAGLFFLARSLAGMAAGVMTTCATSYVADYFGYGSRGRAMGIISSTYFAAAILGVPLASGVAAKWGWRPLFLVNCALALTVAFLVMLRVAGIRPAPENGNAHETLAWNKIGTVLFAHLQRRNTLAILLASLLSSGGIVGFITFLGSHLNTQLGVPVQHIGIVFLWCGLSSLTGAPLSGVVADKWGKKSTLILSGIVLVLCLLLIPHFSWNIWLMGCLGLASFATAFRLAPLLALITELVGPQERGTLLAVRNALSQLGIAGSAFVSSLCYSSQGYRAVGIFSAGLIGLSTVLIALWVKEPGESGAC